MDDDNNERRDVEVFIRRPKPSRPDQTFDSQQELDDFLKSQNLFVTFDELIQEHGLDLPLALSSVTSGFREDNNPVSGVEAMALCKVMGLYPPADIMDWIFQAIWDFSKDETQGETGKVDHSKQFTGDMNKLLGLTGPDRPINNELRRRRNGYIYNTMGVLIRKYGVSASMSAKLIYQREVHLKTWNSTIGIPDIRSIEKGYSQLNPKPHEETRDSYPTSREYAEGFVRSFDVPGTDEKTIQALRQTVDSLFPL